MVEAADCVGTLNMFHRKAEVWIFYQVVLLCVEVIEVQEILRYHCSWVRVRIGLEAQSSQEQVLYGLGQTGL